MDIDAGPAERHSTRQGVNGSRELLAVCRPVFIQSAGVLEAVKAAAWKRRSAFLGRRDGRP